MMGKQIPKNIESDVVVIGSGAGGATIAKELAEKGKKVLILERGKDESTFAQINRATLYNKICMKYRQGFLLESVKNNFKQLLYSDKQIPIFRNIGIGGTTTVAIANATRSLEKELASLGVDIEGELQEAEQELKVTPFPRQRMVEGVKTLWESAKSLGLKFEPMPKFIDFNKCVGCKTYYVTCPRNAKWTAAEFIKTAQKNGALLLQNIKADEIVTTNGHVEGVKAFYAGEVIYIRSNTVILAAGALATPIILQKAGIASAGKKLFCDPCYIVYGSGKNGFMGNDPGSLVDLEFIDNNGFSLYSCSFKSRKTIYLTEFTPIFKKYEDKKGILSVMVKIKDDTWGGVNRNGKIKKSLTVNDISKVTAGTRIAKEILLKAGVDHRSIKIMGNGGYHPGGTAAIGEVVDSNLQTEIKNLFVSDASVLPVAPGLPPILTIIALSKRLAKRL